MSAPTRAAQYLRMSNAQQSQSLELQEATIADYATKHRMEIVRSYADHAKSGLQVRRRQALQQLLKDVQEPTRDFEVVLVLDVGRWGRFQNTDEAAYYEFHCRMWGVRILYVAEPFENDDTPFTAILKNLKRAAAAEYSRELGHKVRAGQRKVVQEGFTASHQPHLGYRRQVVSIDPKRCVELAPGERKAVQSDRVRVILGPKHEQALVRRIFRMYANTDINVNELVRLLNNEGHRTPQGGKFTQAIVRTLLADEIYVGTVVWGKLQRGLTRSVVPFHVGHGAVPALVPKAVFKRAQAKLQGISFRRRTKEVLLQELAEAVAAGKHVAGHTLVGLGLGSISTYEKYFGTLRNAYSLVGHVPPPNYTLLANRTRTWAKAIVAKVASDLEALGAEVYYNNKFRRIHVNGWQLGLQIVLPERHHARTVWPVVKTRVPDCDLLLIVRLESDGSLLDFHLVPIEERAAFPFSMWRSGPARAERFRMPDVSPLALIRM